ncbi:MAG: hypothetical protein B7X04_04405 [Parcubacteria group bacterium 21-54-25]|nr:MAG: hypothetical protein B7X04_04405 [Parcubacteria group bacterium 21-54-25]HQU08309.1 hypothetical protein [Candidatus Paceibacterota bacterium]
MRFARTENSFNESTNTLTAVCGEEAEMAKMFRKDRLWAQNRRAWWKLYRVPVGIALLIVSIGLGAAGWWMYHNEPKRPVVLEAKTASVQPQAATKPAVAPQAQASPAAVVPKAKSLVTAARAAEQLNLKQEAKPRVVTHQKKVRRYVSVETHPARPRRKVRHEWRHWGAAPFAHTFADACRKALMAIDGFKKMPPQVKRHFKRVLGTSCGGGVVEWLSPATQFKEMWAGPDRTHKTPFVIEDVSVAELPVRRSPDGRRYRRGAVAETPKALKWTYEDDGTIYTLDIPYVCFNISWRSSRTTSHEQCVKISFDAPMHGHVHWGVGTKDGPLPPSACNAQRQGSGPYTSWLSQCEECKAPVGYIRNVLHDSSATVPQKFKYPVKSKKQTFRFSTAVESRVVYFCLEYHDGTSTCGVYMRPQDWKGRRHVIIDPSLWRTGHCPN